MLKFLYYLWQWMQMNVWWLDYRRCHLTITSVLSKKWVHLHIHFLGSMVSKLDTVDLLGCRFSKIVVIGHPELPFIFKKQFVKLILRKKSWEVIRTLSMFPNFFPFRSPRSSRCLAEINSLGSILSLNHRDSWCLADPSYSRCWWLEGPNHSGRHGPCCQGKLERMEICLCWGFGGKFHDLLIFLFLPPFLCSFEISYFLNSLGEEWTP